MHIRLTTPNDFTQIAEDLSNATPPMPVQPVASVYSA